jgi:hypothetical protein
MSKNEMLGKLIHSKPHTGQFDEVNHHKELLQLIRDFKADMNGAINTVTNDTVRATISGIFNNHIVRLENKVYSLEDEIK